MSQSHVKKLKGVILCFLVAGLLSPTLLAEVHAQSGGVVVGDWPLSEIEPSGYNVVTPDKTGVNPGIVEYNPLLVDGKFGKAMQFNGTNFVYIPIKFIVGFPPTPQPIYIPVSPNLDIQQYVSVSAWVDIPGYKNATYNNIIVKADHPDQAAAWQNTIRDFGLAIRAGVPGAGESYVQGALSGFVTTDQDGFNEIVTIQPVPLNQWVQVEFIRDSTGMHLYINGYQQSVDVLHGVQNPQGNIENGTEYYIGHDGYATIQDVVLTDLSPPKVSTSDFDIGPNIMIVIVAVSIIFATAWLLRRLIQLWLIRPKP